MWLRLIDVLLISKYSRRDRISLLTETQIGCLRLPSRGSSEESHLLCWEVAYGKALARNPSLGPRARENPAPVAGPGSRPGRSSFSKWGLERGQIWAYQDGNLVKQPEPEVLT